MNQKQLAGEKAVEFVKDGMIVGLGTGSTVYWTIKLLGEKVMDDSLQIKVICTSVETAALASKYNMDVVGFSDINSIDITIDGADEIDPNFNLIKGGGGALFREKIVAVSSNYNIIVADESKIVSKLGKFPLPIEVLPFGWEGTLKRINQVGATSKLRLHNNKKPFVTDNGNYIVDCDFKAIDHPKSLDRKLKLITGVIETGLFIHTTNVVIIGTGHNNLKVISK
ncbi:ribose 5-phosphate isomerase A [Bacillus spongiae]|uniref:Ribose-5-phosphate isomerase A n=1 Tax=Bacillus spongiae TaxID=2683610 RepID=A0ABU8HEV3_9BACI